MLVKEKYDGFIAVSQYLDEFAALRAFSLANVL